MKGKVGTGTTDGVLAPGEGAHGLTVAASRDGYPKKRKVCSRKCPSPRRVPLPRVKYGLVMGRRARLGIALNYSEVASSVVAEATVS